MLLEKGRYIRVSVQLICREDFREEIVLLTETKIKLKFSLPALKMPESIAGECIERRTTRIEPDLVKDDVEVELVKVRRLIFGTGEICKRVEPR